MTDAVTRLRTNLVEVLSLALTGLWLAGLFVGASWWLPVLLVSYVVVIPIAALLFGDESDRREWLGAESDVDEQPASRTRSGPATEPNSAASPSTARGRGYDGSSSRPHPRHRPRSSDEHGGETAGDALETLRNRYAAGKLTDAQFERKLDRLLETETLEDADRWRRDGAERGDREPNGNGREAENAAGERGRERERE